MNRLFLLLAALLIVTPAVASANLLSDAGFEGAGAGPWGGWQNTNVTRDFDATSQVRTGSEALGITWTASIPAYNGGGADQNIAVTAGQLWNAEAYAKVTNAIENGDAYLETKFYNSSWVQQGSDLQSAKLSAVTDWTKLTNSGIVPATAVTAQYRLVAFTWGDSADGAVYFDDANAAIPEPTSMLLLGSGLIGLLGLSRKKR